MKGWLISLQRTASPIALATLSCFASTSLHAVPARGQVTTGEPAPPVVVSSDPALQAPVSVDDRVDDSAGDTAVGDTAGDVAQQSLPSASSSSLSSGGDPGTVDVDPDALSSAPPSRVAPPDPTLALPTGADKSGVTSKTISVPKGSGTIQGMGESFSAQLSTGIATFSVPFSLPAARGGAQQSLGLSYSSSGGFGLAGAGWSVGVPFIARQTDRGVPGYDDQADWHPEQDRFVFNGGQELVPICTVSSGSCTGAVTDELMPVWADGYQYFRPRVEGSFLRFFWSPDHLTWRVQDKSGVTMELGVPLNEKSYIEGIEVNPDKQTEIYRWHLVRQYDTWGNANPATGAPTPRNVVVYRYFQDAGTAHLSDIYDTPPSVGAETAPLIDYAHHTRLVYEQRTDPTHSYRSGWRMDQRLRLARVDVASKMAVEHGGLAAARRMLRRYHLTYDPAQHVSLLTSVQVEGRCTGAEELIQEIEDSNGNLPDSTSCPRLPPMAFEYGHVVPYTTSGAPGAVDLAGYEGFDERIRSLKSSPPHSIDETDTDLFDINSDGLPDVLITAVGMYGSGHGVFFNSAGGVADSFGAAKPMSVSGVLGAGANDVTLKNLNVAPLDLDGDATIDLLHMPKVKTYAVYAPVELTGGWTWQGRAIATASGQSPKIDWGKDALDTQVMDVDFDGLVDVVVSTGTEMQTFFSLGRYAGGDGQFGAGKWTGAATAQISNEPVRTCVPWSATPIRFSDPDIKLADMNGDGINDIVRIRKGDVKYWPGRGNGFWGTGKRDDCPASTFGANRHVQMTSGPQFSDVSGESLRLDDVNGDGLTDLVQVRFTDVDIWLNVDGTGWTDRHIIKGTPPSPSYANRVRLVDVNGSGTRDILWGDGNDYRYIDLQGGERPWILTRVDNGLGKTTDISYSTSTKEMIDAEAAGDPWQTRMPTVTHVVKSVVESDNLVALGDGPALHVTEYSYRDPVFEGRQREFRGFSRARAKRIGDGNSPTDITETTFLLGECFDEDSSDGIDWCGPSERWRDNPHEALKGLPVVTEKLDESGNYLSTDHTRYRLRQLYTGRDGRGVRHAFEVQKDSYLHDVTYGSPTSATTSLTSVETEGSASPTITTSVPLRTAGGQAHLVSNSVVDDFGNRTEAIARGCVDGCADSPNEEITSHTSAIRPSGDPTGWLWRTGTSYVTGNVYTGVELKKSVTTYNAQGAPITVTHHLTGTVDLDRFHAGSGATAPNPPAPASTFDQTISYDDFGNVIEESGPSGRCRGLAYDEEYAQLPTGETTYTAGTGTCSGYGLGTGAEYDRGLALVRLVTDFAGQPTVPEYDGFGRLVKLTRPHWATQGGLNSIASVKIEYFLPTDLGSTPASPIRYSLIHTSTQDGLNDNTEEYLESWSFVDGMGRTRLTLAEADPDPSYGDNAAWIATGLVRYDAKGAVAKKHIDCFWGGAGADPKTYPLASLPPAPCDAQFGTQVYDAFGRQISTSDLDGTVTLVTQYHALGSDIWDAADMEQNGPHENTYASERKDGHGRAAETIERFKDEGGVLRRRHTITTYLPTGEPQKIVRKRNGLSGEVTRWMRYDSLGRMVLNVEPNTTQNYTDDPTTDPTPGANGIKAWRYAYNEAGDLVGTSDARGCGVNFAYDGAGRLLYEDYSPCLEAHAPYSSPNHGARTGIEVLYHYDTQPPSSDYPIDFYASTYHKFLEGKLSAVYDRGSMTVSGFDGRGRQRKVATRIAKPTNPGSADLDIPDRYAQRWYQRAFTYDGADREYVFSTGATISELMSSSGTSYVTTTYTRRGTTKAVSSPYGYLLAGIKRAPDGLITQIKHADSAQTRTDFTYDARRRLLTQKTWRGGFSYWSNPPQDYQPPPNPDSNYLPTFQRVLQDDYFYYDVVGNPTVVDDQRAENHWPDHAKPVDRTMTYDDLYRLQSITYAHEGGSTWLSPFDPENTGADTDPRHAKPSPHVSFTNRVTSQTYAYDWLGNTIQTDDDADGFYDRSLGTIANGSPSGTDPKPYQLQSATNETTPGNPSNNEGNLATAYDPAGNLTRMHLRRAGTCLPTGADCNQIFAYEWDEVGRLVRARRWDVTPANLGTPASALPGTPPDADLRYIYDAGDDRVIKTAVDSLGEQVHTLYVFETLEVRRAGWVEVDSGPPQVFDYELTPWTEVPYLFSQGVRLGRIVYEPSSPTIGTDTYHVVLEIGDHLGSTSIAIDRRTGELVERGTYQAYGGADSDYRPERWNEFREDYRFTGKEEDVEVGLQYFGKRFYAASLNRWVSPDPLEIHVPGESREPNVYAYVSGRALKSIDPLGLEGEPEAYWRTVNKLQIMGLPTKVFWEPKFVQKGFPESLSPDQTPAGRYNRNTRVLQLDKIRWDALKLPQKATLAVRSAAVGTMAHEVTHGYFDQTTDPRAQRLYRSAFVHLQKNFKGGALKNDPRAADRLTTETLAAQVGHWARTYYETVEQLTGSRTPSEARAIRERYDREMARSVVGYTKIDGKAVRSDTPLTREQMNELRELVLPGISGNFEKDFSSKASNAQPSKAPAPDQKKE